MDEAEDQVRTTLEAAALLVGQPVGLAAAATPSEVGDVVERMGAAVERWTAGHPDRSERGLALLGQLAEARLRVQAAELDQRRRCLESVHRSLRRIGTTTTVAELADRVPHEAAALGFRRTLFSWVDQARWVPQSVHITDDPELARKVMEAGSPPYWQIRDLLEGEMVRRRRPMLVRDALDSKRVHRDIQEVMHSRSYVAAPLVRNGRVVAFLHADQNVERGAVDEFDRDMLTLFVEGVALALDRVTVLEEVKDVREQLGTHAEALLDLLQRTDGPQRSRPSGGTPGHLRPAGRLAQTAKPSIWGDSLTPREEQVLGLIADGYTNAEIAERLYITESTAKTHVKHVLRKLGVGNRAQAAALHRSGPSAG